VRTLRQYGSEEAAESARAVAEALASEPGVRLVVFFGSAAVPGGSEEVRDVDLAVLVEPRPGAEEWQRLRAVASRHGSVPVDLVPLHRASVVLAREVADTGICLFSSPPEAETELVTHARARYWDFRPFLEQQWKLTRRRAEERLDHGAPA
jgi:predicted nucleotidyltransferase